MTRFGIAFATALAVILTGCSATPDDPSSTPSSTSRGVVTGALPPTQAATGRQPTPLPTMASSNATDDACAQRPATPPAGVVQRTRLRQLGGGVLGLTVDWVPPVARPNEGHAHTWRPDAPLPPPEPGRHVRIFYTPHPDDETLSMAPLIARATAAGEQVIVVAMTDGRTTGALGAINKRLATEGRASLSAGDIGVARLAELHAATAALDVGPENLVFAHLDAPTSDCGAWVSVGEARDVLTAMAERYPGATHVTMSDEVERNPDHLACGIALRQVVASGVVTQAEWAVSRLWWTLPGPRATWVRPEDPDQRRAVEAALAAYSLWDPAHRSYAIGETSVRVQFEAARTDPRARVHTVG